MPSHFSSDLKDLLSKMLKKKDKDRITARDAMNHPWFSSASEAGDVNEEEYLEVMKRLTAFNGQSKLKRAAINMIVKQMSDD